MTANRKLIDVFDEDVAFWWLQHAGPKSDGRWLWDRRIPNEERGGHTSQQVHRVEGGKALVQPVVSLYSTSKSTGLIRKRYGSSPGHGRTWPSENQDRIYVQSLHTLRPLQQQEREAIGSEKGVEANWSRYPHLGWLCSLNMKSCGRGHMGARGTIQPIVLPKACLSWNGSMLQPIV